MKTFEELLKITDSGACRQKMEENEKDIEDVVEDTLFDYGYEEELPGRYTSRDFSLIKIDSFSYDLYEGDEFVETLSWIEVVDNLQHYDEDQQIREYLEKMRKLSDTKEHIAANSGFIALNSTGEIQLTKEWFLKAFDEYQISSRNSEAYPYEFSIWIAGYRYFCLSEIKEVN